MRWVAHRSGTARPTLLNQTEGGTVIGPPPENSIRSTLGRYTNAFASLVSSDATAVWLEGTTSNPVTLLVPIMLSEEE